MSDTRMRKFQISKGLNLDRNCVLASMVIGRGCPRKAAKSVGPRLESGRGQTSHHESNVEHVRQKVVLRNGVAFGLLVLEHDHQACCQVGECPKLVQGRENLRRTKEDSPRGSQWQRERRRGHSVGGTNQRRLLRLLSRSPPFLLPLLLPLSPLLSPLLLSPSFLHLPSWLSVPRRGDFRQS